MKFNELDNKLRIYETAHDFCVPPNIYMVARIDGRSFTRLTKEKQNFDRPFDVKFRDLMIETVKHLMNCGFQVIYGYTESDEILLLFNLNISVFSRKIRKYNSILAGEASAKFSVLLGDIGVFDCRISQLPRKTDVVDYFRWRSEDAHRNALNAHCYWMLRNKKKSAKEATKEIEGKSNAFKNEMLFKEGLNFNDFPKWQKRGIGFYWTDIKKEGFNPITNQKETAIRNELKVDLELPMGNKYSEMIKSLIENGRITSDNNSHK